MLPVLNLGPLAIQVPGLALLLSLWLGLSLSERHAARRGVDPNALYNLVFSALIAGVLGARLAYIARYPAAFMASPLDLVSLNPGLLDAWGGAAVALIAALIYAQRSQLPLLPLLDALVPALAALQIGMGLADLASGAGFGAPADLPWALELWGERRHPTQLYAALGALLILLAFWPAGRLDDASAGSGQAAAQPLLFQRLRALTVSGAPGQSFLAFLAAGALLRVLVESFRGDSALLPGGFRTAQVLAWLLLAAALYLNSKLKIDSAVKSCTLTS